MCLEEIGNRIGERQNDSLITKIGVVRKNCEINIKVRVHTFLIERTDREYSCVQLN